MAETPTVEIASVPDRLMVRSLTVLTFRLPDILGF